MPQTALEILHGLPKTPTSRKSDKSRISVSLPFSTNNYAGKLMRDRRPSTTYFGFWTYAHCVYWDEEFEWLLGTIHVQGASA